MTKFGEVMYIVFLSGLRISQEYVPDAIELISSATCPVCRKTLSDEEVPDAGEVKQYQCFFCDAQLTVEAWEVEKKAV